ncbi:hypothetical protein A9F13_13g00561 [Clavispora lusitaniae]|uniref:Uncharacterized protein n=1 Tax=Clavispora lusitaniae TaxID=36911 RepID=A0AA91PXE5_CLALS|nr:hypothetical protein A9F13_13g00561 [Clavispora lusitaniae]
MSSPSRQVIDPLIYTYPENEETGKGKPSAASTALPPASKILNASSSTQQNTAITGWTPLITRTLSNEVVSYNSTPSSKMFPGISKSSAALANGGGSTVINSEYDYPSLNLTPFLTHNLNLLNNPNSAGNLSNNINFTPFYDKSLHLNDFFMDSPIRQTPSKVETITPSKFLISTDPKSSTKNFKAKLQAEQTHKRSITSLETPARQPFKKYNMSFKQEDAEFDGDEEYENRNAKKYDDEGFVTPSKKNILHDISASMINKTPLKSTPLNNNKGPYQTPGKVPNSSPSTVIMSSATKSPEQEGKDRLIPISPTPNKDKIEVTEPVMGIFSERKGAVKASDLKPSNKKSQKKPNGMNRFQIVFTDVHTLMNTKKKKSAGNTSKPDKADKKSDKKKVPTKAENMKNYSPGPQYSKVALSDSRAQQNLSSFHHTSSNLSASQDFNSTMNTSKEFSIIANNSTVNTTANNLNSSSDQHSFDLMHGGMISTPNGKFLLENSFDEQSPQIMRHCTLGNMYSKSNDAQNQMLPPKSQNNVSLHHQQQYLQLQQEHEHSHHSTNQRQLQQQQYQQEQSQHQNQQHHQQQQQQHHHHQQHRQQHHQQLHDPQFRQLSSQGVQNSSMTGFIMSTP